MLNAARLVREAGLARLELQSFQAAWL